MKFGRRLIEESHPLFKHYYLSYKDLKKAIKLITGADASAYSIREVASNFGNAPAFAGSIFRPPEARFQDLLNAEKEKINKFTEVTISAINSALKSLMKHLIQQAETLGNSKTGEFSLALKSVEEREAAVDEQSEQLLFLESYQKLNHIGFRKITKKYDKHNKSNSSAWYMAQLSHEPFLNIDFAKQLEVLSVCYEVIRQLRKAASGDAPTHHQPDTNGTEEEDRTASNSCTQDAHNADAPADQTKDHRSMSGSLSADGLSEKMPADDNQKENLPNITMGEFPVATNEHAGQTRTMKYLVKDDEVLRLKVLMLKFIPLASLGDEEVSHKKIIKFWLDPVSSMQTQNNKRREIASFKKLSHCCCFVDTPEFDTYQSVVSRKAPSEAPGSNGESPHAQGQPPSWQLHKRATPFNLAQMARFAGTKVFRLRWVGENNGEDGKDIFLEHVSLTESSASACEWPDVYPDNALGNVPDCVVLKLKHVTAIFNGTFDLDLWMARKKYTGQRAEEIRKLLSQACNEIREKQLKPKFQTWFYRTAFRENGQKAKKSESPQDAPFISVNLDENVRFVSEVDRAGDKTYRSNPANILLPYTAALAEEEIETLHFGVLTIAFRRLGDAEVIQEKLAAKSLTLIPVGGGADERDATPTSTSKCDLEEGEAEEKTGEEPKLGNEVAVVRDAQPLPERRQPDFSHVLQVITGVASVTEIWGFSFFVHGMAHVCKDIRNIDLALPHWFVFVRSTSTNDRAGDANKHFDDSDADDDEEDDKRRRNGDDDDDDSDAEGTRHPDEVNKGKRLSKSALPLQLQMEAEEELLQMAQNNNNLRNRLGSRMDSNAGLMTAPHSGGLDYMSGRRFSQLLGVNPFINAMGGQMMAPGTNNNGMIAPLRESGALNENAEISLLPPPRFLDGSSGSTTQQAYGLPFPMACAGHAVNVAQNGGAPLADLSQPLLAGTRSQGSSPLRGVSPAGEVAGHTIISMPMINENGVRQISNNSARPANARGCSGVVRKCLAESSNKCCKPFVWLAANTCGAAQTPGAKEKKKPATVRVEPKSFFANERTLLQWMNIAVLIATISITLLNFGTSTSKIAGLFMAPVAIYFIVHSYLMYVRRNRSLLKKEAVDYNDRVGPLMLVITLTVALSLVVLLNVGEALSGTSKEAATASPALRASPMFPIPSTVGSLATPVETYGSNNNNNLAMVQN